MKMTTPACVVLLLTAIASAAQAAETASPPGGPGVGVVLGDPIGGTLRHFLAKDRSVDAGVGFSGETAFWFDHAWHSWDMLPRPAQGAADLWVSAGLRIETAADAELGIRTMLGGSYWLPKGKVELFATLGPLFRVTPSGGVGVDGGIGVRFYFGGAP